MKLEKYEREYIKGLVEHKGFEVMKKIVSGMESDLFAQFKKSDLSKEETQIRINGSQNMLAGAEQLIAQIEAYSKDIVKKVL